MIFKFVPLFCGLSFLDNVLWNTEVFNFDESIFLLFLVLLFLRTYCIIQVHDLLQHFLLRDFLVLLLIFRSLIHFELIFYMVGIRSPISFFWWCLSSCSNIIFLKRLFFPLSIYLGMLSENQLTRDIALWSFIWVCLFFLIESSSFFSYKNF